MGKSLVPYTERFDELKSLLDTHNPSKIELVLTRIVPDIQTATAFFQEMLGDEQEGIILKDVDSIWENKRSKSQVKFKGVLETDLRVVDIQMGTGKYEGMLGAIVCESSDGIIKVNVGSGFSDEQRKSLDYIDKIVAIKYNARISNKQGEQSLFLPVFVETRDDKDIADSSLEIK
jgi:ATP-dependent DNA ligase